MKEKVFFANEVLCKNKRVARKMNELPISLHQSNFKVFFQCALKFIKTRSHNKVADVLFLKDISFYFICRLMPFV
jgi:hypothetical protein